MCLWVHVVFETCVEGKKKRDAHVEGRKGEVVIALSPVGARLFMFVRVFHEVRVTKRKREVVRGGKEKRVGRTSTAFRCLVCPLHLSCRVCLPFS